MFKNRVRQWLSRWQRLKAFAAAAVHDPGFTRDTLKNLPLANAGHRFAATWPQEVTAPAEAPAETPNPLREFFASHDRGNGIYKWTHYFDTYHRHLARFLGQPAHLAEVGVLGGGSLDMWSAYLGEQGRIYGIDIEAECTKYARGNIRIFVGDQQDRAFWAGFRQQVPILDIVIDDGGHQPQQQTVTLEETLPHLRPGGVYICEDILGIHNGFAAYAAALVASLNQACRPQWGETRCLASPFQRAVHSIHFYPYLLVIEKGVASPEYLTAITRGTDWPSYLRVPRQRLPNDTPAE